MWLSLCCVCCLMLLMLHCELSCSLFEQCNHNVQLEAGQRVYVNSPYYPGEYPPGTSCRYTLQAPADYTLKLKCDIQLNTSPSDKHCRHEAFHFNPQGDELLSNTEYFCGSGNFERKSFLNRAVISYISTPLAQRKFATKLPGYVQNKLAKKKLHAEAVQASEQKQKVSSSSSSSLLAAAAGNEQAAKPATGAMAAMVATVETSTMSAIKDDIKEAIAEQEKDDNGDDDDSNDDADEDEDDDDADSDNDDDDDDDNNLTDDVLQALTHVDADKALAYVTSLLYNEETDEGAADLPNNGKPITNGCPREKLPKSTWQDNNGAPTTKTSKTSVKRAKIVSGVAVGLDDADVGSAGRFSCLVEVAAPACACGWSMSVRIAGATAEAGLNEFPSMAGVQYKKNGQVFCGATIIHQRYLLSAAHCFSTPESNNTSLIRVIVGELDLATVLESFYTRHYDIERIIPHELFNAQAAHLHNDLALLRTRLPISWSLSVGPACLPFRSGGFLTARAPLAGQRLDVAGWGTTSFGGAQSSRLLKTTLNVIDVQRCRQLLQSATPAHSFCTLTAGRDSCQYDSGGALYERSNGLLMAVGIVSYGYACASQQPAVNTHVASFAKWIANKTPDAVYCVK